MKSSLLTFLAMGLTVISMAQSNDANKPTFNPTIKMKALVHVRYEMSGTDSVDVQGKFSADPLKTDFRIRRAELRADVKLNDHWSGVIRVQLPELKTTSFTMGRVIELAYFEYKYVDQLSVRGGQFKVPFELDELTSHEDLRMIDRGPTSRMFVNNYWSSYQPGLMVFGTFFKSSKPVNYYVGVFNGNDRSLNFDTNNGKAGVARVEFYPVPSLRLGINGEISGIARDITGNAEGADISLIQPLNDDLNLIIEGEYVSGTNSLLFTGSTDSTKAVKDFRMSGYFGQALLRIKIGMPGLQTFEVGGRYERTDPLNTDAQDDYSTITGGIGFIFLPDNDARLQLNVVHTNYKDEIPGVQKNNNIFLAQLQLKI
jgi:hypothetical protein